MAKTLFTKTKEDYTFAPLWKDFEKLRFESARQDEEILQLESKIRAYEFYLKSIGYQGITSIQAS